MEVAPEFAKIGAGRDIGVSDVCLGILEHGSAMLIDESEGVVDVGELVGGDVCGGEVLRLGGPAGVIADDPPRWRRHGVTRVVG